MNYKLIRKKVTQSMGFFLIFFVAVASVFPLCLDVEARGQCHFLPYFWGQVFHRLGAH